jgi:hypothetical protein
MNCITLAGPKAGLACPSRTAKPPEHSDPLRLETAIGDLSIGLSLGLPGQWQARGSAVRDGHAPTSFGYCELLFQKLIDVRGSHHIDSRVDDRRNRFSLGEVVHNVDTLNAHGVWPLAD